MAKVSIVSWNVRGMHSPLKRTMLLMCLKKYLPGVICFQETHLTVETVCFLKYAWVGKAYHSTHTSFSRGVSVLVHSALDFQEIDSAIDPEGRYVFIHCKMGNLICVIACVYIPPPFTAAVLRLLLSFLDGRPDVPLLVLGDFNCCLDQVADRHPAPRPSALARSTPLARLLQEVGWVDIWRHRNPGGRQFTCFSKTHGCLSRIDLGVGNLSMLPLIADLSHRPRSVSDHSALVIQLLVAPQGNLVKAPWKLNAFWLKLIRSHEEILEEVRGYFAAGDGMEIDVIHWDAFKAYLRGLLIREVNGVKKASTALLIEVESRVQDMERAYIADPSDLTRETWQAAQTAYQQLLSSSAEKKRFFAKQAFFEEGEKTGRILARIANSHQRSPAIGAIRSGSGGIVSQPEQIMQELAGFYEILYSPGMTYAQGDLELYLAQLAFPGLSDAQRTLLDKPLTVEEMMEAVSAFPNCKAPGEDGLPMEVYKQYSEVLLPLLLKVFNNARERGTLPPSMTKANIVLLLKPGKDPVDPGAYRPISLLQSDIKILAKVLAIRLNGVITSIVHGDQAGFMPNKSTAVNLRRLFLNMQARADNMGSRALLSLDATKAFDSIDWNYLWTVLQKFGFGPVYISWVRLLYSQPRAAIRTFGSLSGSFALRRGTRQGCPLSPLLFALAIEPLAISIRTSPRITGFCYGNEQEKVMLYADDTLLLLGDMDTSLREAMETILEFGKFSGLLINWSKSALLLLDCGDSQVINPLCPIPITSSFKYLGVQITARPRDFIHLNISPLLLRFRDKIKTWKALLLSVAGRVNLIKMILMPQLLYFLHNTPMVIPLKVFHTVNSIFRGLIWKDGAARIKLEHLQRPKDSGGLALPNPWLYYLAAQMQQLVGMFRPTVRSSAQKLMERTVGGGPIPEALEAQAFAKPHKKFPTFSLIQKVWNKVKYVQNAEGYTKYSPIWQNDTYIELAKLQSGARWRQYGITHLTHIFRNGVLRTFPALQETFGLPQSMYFSYVQLRHAVVAQGRSSEWYLSPTPAFDLLGEAGTSKGFISQCYATLLQYVMKQHPLRIRERWEADAGELDGEQWEEIFQAVSQCSLNVSQRLTQLYILLRTYYTPHRLHRMNPQLDPTCTRCKRDHGGLIHML